ncbi:MAG: RNA polymerase sigma factor [Candidatus Marinimicrobia bacterium]|nr:RNA polymerase sigma factor [Candidatus Neomarinimicrobiota bacterium]MCF7904080.1 RNA polymerase sigma factor [Candidatus Neomarinimicrobiota bacterium]
MSDSIQMKPRSLTSAFNACVRDHFDYVYQVALVRSGNRTLAQDITQETFIRVYKGLSNFRQDAQLSTWIYRITMNVCHTYLKKESTHQLKQTLPDVEDSLHQTSTLSPEEALFRENRKTQVWVAIQTLTPAQADVITLYYLKEYDYTEIAEILQMPMGTVKSHLHRAKQSLKQYLEGKIDEF